MDHITIKNLIIDGLAKKSTQLSSASTTSKQPVTFDDIVAPYLESSKNESTKSSTKSSLSETQNQKSDYLEGLY